MECKARINMILFGGICCLLGLKDYEKPDAVCRDALGRKYASALEKNLEGIHRGFYEVETQMKSSPKSTPDTLHKHLTPASEGIKGTAPRGQMATAPCEQARAASRRQAATRGLTGGAIPWLGNSVINDLSPSRQGYIPLFFPDRCIQCAQCDATCPDMVFQFQPGTYKGREMMINMGLDYYHCKGCMRCVTICPVNALVAAKESEYPQKPYFVPNQELVRKPAYYEACGVDGYITSESFLTEKRVDGGQL